MNREIFFSGIDYDEIISLYASGQFFSVSIMNNKYTLKKKEVPKSLGTIKKGSASSPGSILMVPFPKDYLYYSPLNLNNASELITYTGIDCESSNQIQECQSCRESFYEYPGVNYLRGVPINTQYFTDHEGLNRFKCIFYEKANLCSFQCVLKEIHRKEKLNKTVGKYKKSGDILKNLFYSGRTKEEIYLEESSDRKDLLISTHNLAIFQEE